MEVCSQNLNDPNTVLLKVNGNKCNMACKYCSELPKHFTDEQCRFDFEKIEKILERLPKNVDIILHGGEPSLIGKENVLKIAKRIKEFGFKIKPSIQTNGLLNSEWIDFFAAHSDLIRVSVSIDGYYECNKFRRTITKDSKKAFDVVNSFLEGIDEKGVEFRCIATINSLSWDKGESIIRYFSKFNNLKFVRLNPCFDIDDTGVKEWAITPTQYLCCLKTAFLTMLNLQTYKRFKLDPLMDMFENGKRDANEFEFKCDKFSSIFPDGMVTSCDAMREVKQDLEVNENMFNNFVQPDYTETIIRKCKQCPYISICKGGCLPLMNRYMKYNQHLLEEYCEYRVSIRKYVQEVLK